MIDALDIYIYKRVLGVIVATLMLMILWPIMLLAALAVRIDSKGPAIFKQKRIGLNGKPYDMYKFRSMVVGAQTQGTGLYSFSGDTRITKVGRFIRKTSLDELPQLVNVIKGDMAFVGPRSPVVGGFPEYDSLNEAYKRRFSVLPGITGLAQVVGRNEFTWDEKVKFDNIYIDKVLKCGLLYDIYILLLTVKRVFSMSDVAEKPENMKANQEAMGTIQTNVEMNSNNK